MYKPQTGDLCRSSRDLITASTDKEEPSSMSSGGPIQIDKAGAVQYMQESKEWLQEVVGRYHSHSHDELTRCSSVAVQRVEAPVSVVWSLLRRFDEPQIYKQLVRSCLIRPQVPREGEGEGDLKVKVGCLREIRVVSGLPGTTSTERLDILDNEQHILSFTIVGGEHRLCNYRSITTLHETLMNGGPGTVVIESYVVDVPHGNTKEDTCLFLDTIVKLNLQSLAHVSKNHIGTDLCI